MSMTFDSLAPNDKFVVTSQRAISDIERQSLTVLYRPLMSSDAYSLLNSLWSIAEQGQFVSDQYNHIRLLNWLGIDIKAINTARSYLEALGLLDTYVDTTNRINQFIYELKIPKTPQDFFTSDLLATILLGVVGNDTFDELVSQFKSKLIPTDGYTNVSAKLDDIFSMDSVSNNLSKVKQSQQSFDNSNSSSDESMSELNQQFDFGLLRNLLSKSYLNLDDLVANEHLIQVEQTVYGISETQMAEIINSATNFETNRIDTDLLKQLIAQRFDLKVKQQGNAKSDSEEQPVQPSVDDTSLTAVENEIMKACYAYNPSDFLQSIKSEVGGYPTSSEKRVLESVVSYGVLPISVINFLIYYVLVDQERPTLNKNFVDAIANDWSKRNIKTPEDALKQIKQRIEKQQTRRQQTYKKTVIKKETLPDWADSSSSKKESTAKQATVQNSELDDKLSKLRKTHKKEG